MGIREINMQEEIPHYTKEQVYGILIPTIGKTLEELDINRVFDKTVMNPKVTGIAGDVIEQSVFGYKANNKQIPDLNVDNEDVELKTIGIQEKSRGLWYAKEPCSITAVSISTIEQETFETSKFWHKSQRILFVYYHYLSKMTVKAAGYKDFQVKNFYFYNCTDDDKVIIASDWQKVHDFIADIYKRYPDKESRKKEYPNLSTVVNKRASWEEAKRLVQTGELTVTVMRRKDGSVRYTAKTGIEMLQTNLPKALDNVIFFRGTGKDATDKVIVNGLKMLRQNYWVKGTYVVELLNKMKYLGEYKKG